MIDATAKPQAGILYGNILHVGNYDECIKVEKFVNGTRILGKYCQVQYSTKFNEELLPPLDEENVIYIFFKASRFLVNYF